MYERRKTHLYAMVVNNMLGAGDMSLVQHALINNGLQKERLIGLNRSDNPYQPEFIKSKSSIAGFKNAVEGLSKVVTPLDRLLLHFSTHGEIVDGEHVIRLQDDELLTASNLEQIIGEIGIGRIIMYFGQCYGGGFAEKLGKGNNIAISASSSTEQAHANMLMGSSIFAGKLYPTIVQNYFTVGEAFDEAVKEFEKINISLKMGETKETPEIWWQNVNPWHIKLY